MATPLPRPFARLVRSLALVLVVACVFAQAAKSAPETEIRYLSGKGSDDAKPWEFRCTAGRKAGPWTHIPVPSCWEQEGFGTYEYGLEHRPSKKEPSHDRLVDEQGEYRLAFEVPEKWRTGHVKIVFEGVMTDADVRINGKSAGAVHQGAFYRFEYDVTGLLTFGANNLLEVTVSKKSANPSVNNAERFGDYWNFGGIFRPVYLEAFPNEYIDRTAINAKADGAFSAEVFLGGSSAEERRVEGQILSSDGREVGPLFTSNVSAGSTQATLTTRVDRPSLWSAETPTLYRLRLTLVQADQPENSLSTKFGFRTFEVRPKDGLYLNGSKIRLKGADRHSFWPESGRTLNRTICFADARLMKRANMNAVRMSHYPPDADFMEACDELGLYVLDELAGWHGAYDTPTGTRLVGEMVRRDVNHPSILFWDNGNEGGNNLAIDNQFAVWDPQKRSVLHPWALFSDVATFHYRNYRQTEQATMGPDIFMPTEFLHGLYDGGAGAGLEDYWALMGHRPLAAGGFIWALLDESVARTDQNGRLDSKDSWAPDGIVGPHREPEGSFFTIRQIWSPIQVGPDVLPPHFDGTLSVENDYDFIDLSQCTFKWVLARFPALQGPDTEHQTIASGSLGGPSGAPHTSTQLRIPLPASWKKADVLYLSACNPSGVELWTWSWSWKPASAAFVHLSTVPKGSCQIQNTGEMCVVRAGMIEARFDRTTGHLAALKRGNQSISLTNGPRLVAYRRNQRTFEDVGGLTKLTGFQASVDDGSAVIQVDYQGALQHVRWRIAPDGDLQFDYDIALNGTVDLLGVMFDYPESLIKGKRWLGAGPYHVWQNRLKGTVLDVYRNAYNDPVPGDSWAYPEFKGFFADWKWAEFDTSEGKLAFLNPGDVPYLGVFRPNDGRVSPIQILPELGLGAYHVIPAVGSKFTVPDVIGPQSQPKSVSGVQHGSLTLRVMAP